VLVQATQGRAQAYQRQVRDDRQWKDPTFGQWIRTFAVITTDAKRW
jgi:hypothetical protein